jgi:hypothetical protein
MNLLKILNEPEALQEVIKWIIEGENYSGGGIHFKNSIEKSWPTFWKSLYGFFKNSKDIVKKQIEVSDIMTSSNVGYELWLNFGTYPKPEKGKAGFIRNRLIFKIDKDLDVVAHIPSGGKVS